MKETKSSFLSLSLPFNRQMGKVHSVFKTSFNIMINDRLFNFSQEGMSLSAHGCVLSQKTMHDLLNACAPGDIVKTEYEKIYLYTTQGVFLIDLSDFTEIDLGLKKITIPMNSIVNTAAFQSLEAVSFDKQIGIECNYKTKEILTVLKTLPLRSMREQKDAAAFLIGRGKGLTPSGDDILSGFIMIRKSFLKKDSFEEIVKEVLIDHRTTDISEAYYKALFSGYVSSLFLSFLFTFDSEELIDVGQLINRIGMYGHTSGYDTLLGMYLGLQSLIYEMEE